MMYIRDLIKKKQNRKELTEEEIRFFISSYNNDEILEEQAAALLTLMHDNGLTAKEMSYLAIASAETGEVGNIYNLSEHITDINPIGGMDDKIIIILLAVLSALELPSFKIIGREIGLKDKLIGTRLYKLTDSKVKKLINEHKIAFIEEVENLAPVENKLYKLRNEIACNNDVNIIAINLMSQKVALGFTNVVFDISYGEKAYVKTLSDAEKLARVLSKMGANLDINVKCIITRLDEPVGQFFGNILELKEILDALQGKMFPDVLELVLELGDMVIQLESDNNNSKENKEKILEVLRNKRAYYRLIELLAKDVVDFTQAKYKEPVIATAAGYVETINMSFIRSTAQYLHSIRHTEDIKVDHGAGIEFVKKISDKVDVGETIAYIHTNDEEKISKAVENIKVAFNISRKKVKSKSRIVEKI